MASGNRVSSDGAVTVRLIQEADDKTAMSLVLRTVFINTMNDLILYKVTSSRVITWSLGLGITGFSLKCSLVHGILCFLILPLFIYVMLRWIALPSYLKTVPDFVQGFHSYWSRNDLGRFMWVAEVDGAVVATTALKIMSRDSGQIFRVTVDPRYARRGLASRVLETVMETCESRDLEHVILQTSIVQKKAQRFYAKRGFRVVNEHTWSYLSVTIPTLLFHQNLKGGPFGSTGEWGKPDGVALAEK